MDQAAMHEAYLAGGTDAIEELRQAGIIDTTTRDAWLHIDEGARNGRTDLVAAGNQLLLRREQIDVINDDYVAMRQHQPTGPAVTYLATVVGSPSIPEALSPGKYSPVELSVPVRLQPPPLLGGGVAITTEVTTPLPDFNISVVERRWAMIVGDTLPAYQRLLVGDQQRARDLVAAPLAHRIDQHRLLGPRAEELARDLLTNWDVSARLDVPLSRRG